MPAWNERAGVSSTLILHLSRGLGVDHSDRMSPLSPDEPLLANETDSKVEINGHSDDLLVIYYELIALF